MRVAQRFRVWKLWQGTMWWWYVTGEVWTQKRRINLSLSLLPTPNIDILLRYQQADKNKVPDKGTFSLHLLTSWRGDAAVELWHLPVTTSNDCSMLLNSLTDHWRGQIYLEHLPALKYSSLQEKHIQEIYINCLTTEWYLVRHLSNKTDPQRDNFAEENRKGFLESRPKYGTTFNSSCQQHFIYNCVGRDKMLAWNYCLFIKDLH